MLTDHKLGYIYHTRWRQTAIDKIRGRKEEGRDSMSALGKRWA
jgi:hypothetical protein